MLCRQYWLENLGDLGIGPGVSIPYGVVVSKLLEGLDFSSCKTKRLNQWLQGSPSALPFQDHRLYDLLKALWWSFKMLDSELHNT